jgi:hypothetical protein
MHRLVASFHKVLISGLSMISRGSTTPLVYLSRQSQNTEASYGMLRWLYSLAKCQTWRDAGRPEAHLSVLVWRGDMPKLLPSLFDADLVHKVFDLLVQTFTLGFEDQHRYYPRAMGSLTQVHAFSKEE